MPKTKKDSEPVHAAEAPTKDTHVKHSIHGKASEHQAFLLCTGAAIHSVKQLGDELENVDEGVYYYHTQNGRNDFAQWIQDIFGDKALAESVRASHNKEHLRATLYKHLLEA